MDLKSVGFHLKFFVPSGSCCKWHTCSTSSCHRKRFTCKIYGDFELMSLSLCCSAKFTSQIDSKTMRPTSSCFLSTNSSHQCIVYVRQGETAQVSITYSSSLIRTSMWALESVKRLAASINKQAKKRFKAKKEKQHQGNSLTVKKKGGSSNDEFSLVFALAKTWAWNAVLFRCQSHPHEVNARFIDSVGDNILHWVAFGRPPLDVVDTLLSICPDLAEIENMAGMLPLHMACMYRASAEVISSIIAAYPQGVKKATHSGSYPLHLACSHGCSVEVLKALLSTPEGVETAFLFDNSRTALQYLEAENGWSGFYCSYLFMKTADDARRMQLATRSTQQRLSESAAQYWRKISILNAVMYTRKPYQESDFCDDLVLKACLSNSMCIQLFQEFAMLAYSNSAMVPDDNGCLPLHIAASSGNHNNISRLVEIAPEAASVRKKDGTLPFQLALQSYKSSTASNSDYIFELLQANPVALQEIDLNESVYPYVWSRINSASALYQCIQSSLFLFERR